MGAACWRLPKLAARERLVGWGGVRVLVRVDLEGFVRMPRPRELLEELETGWEGGRGKEKLGRDESWDVEEREDVVEDMELL